MPPGALAPPVDLPRELQVEVTAACNLRCEMCLVAYRPPLDRAHNSFSIDAFRDLLDELPDLEKITLQGLGEPLLAPDLFAMIEAASERGIRVGFNTNATVLSRRKAERLVAAGLDWLHVSLDGATPATYEAIRQGSNFARVRRNVIGLVDVMRASGATKPNLSLVFVAMRRNIAELCDVVRLADEWGVGCLRVQNLSHTFDDCDPSGDYVEIRSYAEREALFHAPSLDVDEHFAAAARTADRLGVDLRLPDATAPVEPAGPGERACDWPWRSAYVTAQGQVQPCCMVMGADRAVLGDLDASSFTEVWRSDEYASFRAGLVDGPPPTVCRGCSMYRGVF
jgi:radical SAM protein with 4Fe4S-binding SPASM domain